MHIVNVVTGQCMVIAGVSTEQQDDHVSCPTGVEHTRNILEEYLSISDVPNLAGTITNISPERQGEGGYWDVFTGNCSKLPSNRRVAIKRLRIGRMESEKYKRVRSY